MSSRGEIFLGSSSTEDDAAEKRQDAIDLCVKIFAFVASAICFLYVCWRNSNIRRIVVDDEDYTEGDQIIVDAYKETMDSISMTLKAENFVDSKREDADSTQADTPISDNSNNSNSSSNGNNCKSLQQDSVLVEIPSSVEEGGSRTVERSCTICLIPYEVGDEIVGSTVCDHAFHRSCMTKWFVRHGSPQCPICRSDFVCRTATPNNNNNTNDDDDDIEPQEEHEQTEERHNTDDTAARA